jgi:hypothetical protein
MRDWYLSMLGIVQYRLRPREGAANIDTGQTGSDLVGEKNTDGSVDAVAMPGKRVKPAPGERAPARSELELDDQPVEVEDLTQSDSIDDSIAFHLTCWRPSEDLLVIDSRLPGTDDERQTAQLIANILRSIGRLPDQLAEPESINWPLTNDSGLSAAQEHVSMFLKGRYQQQPFTWLLAMGSEINLCLADSIQTHNANSVGQRLACGADVIFTHSLSDMIETPICKKEVWSAIQFLCAT